MGERSPICSDGQLSRTCNHTVEMKQRLQVLVWVVYLMFNMNEDTLYNVFETNTDKSSYGEMALVY